MCVCVCVQVLVFTQSLLMIELIERLLEGHSKAAWKLGKTYFRLDGSTVLYMCTHAYTHMRFRISKP